MLGREWCGTWCGYKNEGLSWMGICPGNVHASYIFFNTLNLLYSFFHLYSHYHIATPLLSLFPALPKQTNSLHSMSSITCAGCNRQFSHTGYTCHLSMTTRTICRAIYDNCLNQRPAVLHDRTMVFSPEDGISSESLCWLDHASSSA